MECKTYRWTGHFVGDLEQPYRTKLEVEEWKGKCPIKRLEAMLIQNQMLDEEQVKKIGEEVKKEIDEAIEFAKASPYPSSEELETFVF